MEDIENKRIRQHSKGIFYENLVIVCHTPIRDVNWGDHDKYKLGFTEKKDKVLGRC
jgi:hypothetical protein